ncbi:BatD family protein [Pedobacter sp. MC2016-24]|uniref:BatD family protein n=1 Tax=Pedobacter sp. MC2016-24 TaxID=2780090 RepID=UPI001880426C|nr:BatD family protein [Pedobacter sp. MC2016-24]MBE9601462.1 protein BatD [Pedobacter sp. MC2016-24]
MNIKHYILSILLLWTTALSAQDIKFTASVSKNQVGTGEAFEISFSVNGNIEKFSPPQFNGFQVYSGPNQSSSMTSINGNTTMSLSLSYDLLAVKEGEYTIGPATVVVNGKQIRSNSVKVKVVKGQAVTQQHNQGGGNNQQQVQDRQPEGKPADISKRLFIRAVPNKTNPFQGEQVTVTYKLYTNIELVDNALDKLPDFNGFWSQEIKNNDPNVRWETENYQGSRYNVAVLKQIILFPTRSGKLVLDPLGMTFLVRQAVQSNDPFDMFFGSYKDAKYKIKSAVVPIQVKPLPEAGKPADFGGAVGNFTLKASLDKPAVKANEAINYSLKISGSGNLNLMNAPAVNFPADVEKYDPKITDKITESLSGLSGSRQYDYLLIPRHEGNFTISGVNFSYFNPATQRYVTLTAEPFAVKVAKGDPGSNVTAFTSGNQQDVKLLSKDIQYIRTSDSGLIKSDSEFHGSIGYYFLLLIGPIAFAAAMVWRNRNRENNKDQVKVRERNANKMASKHLANARNQLSGGNEKAFYEAIYKGLYGYLSHKFNIDAADLSLENIKERLEESGVGEARIAQLTETLNLCEMARYAPVSGISQQEVFDKAKNIINDIENA